MPSLVPSLVTGALPRLGVDPAVQGGFEKWLSAATITPLISPNLSIWRYSVTDLDELIPFLAFDFERFSLATAESFLRATQNPARGLNHAGWRLLELYYSAFFAAHALMRSQGAAVATISAATAKRVSDIATLYDPNIIALQAGTWFYRVRVSDDETYIEFRSAVSGAGVHDAFWREFCSFVKLLAAEAVKNGLPDGADFVVGADEIASRIREAGDGSASWLAKIRNELNYKHAHSAWHPEPKHQTATSAITAVRLMRSDAIRLDASKSKAPLAAFASTCSYLSSLSFEVSSYLAERSTRGAAFGQKWRKFTDLTKLVITQ